MTITTAVILSVAAIAIVAGAVLLVVALMSTDYETEER